MSVILISLFIVILIGSKNKVRNFLRECKKKMQWLDFQNPVLPNRTTRIPSGHQPHLRGGALLVLRRVSRNLRTVYANAFEERI